MTSSIINLDVIGFPPYGYKLYQQCSLRFSFAVNFQDMILNSEEIWGKPPEHLHGFLIGSFPEISLTAMGWVSAFLWPWRDGNVRSFSLSEHHNGLVFIADISDQIVTFHRNSLKWRGKEQTLQSSTWVLWNRKAFSKLRGDADAPGLSTALIPVTHQK